MGGCLLILLFIGLLFTGAFIPMLQFLLTAILYLAAGCPDPDASAAQKPAPAASEQSIEQWLEDGGERAGKAAAGAARATKRAVKAGGRRLQRELRDATEETHSDEPE